MKASLWCGIVRRRRYNVAIETNEGGGDAVGFDEIDEILGFEPDGGGVVARVDADDAGAFFLGVDVKEILI